MQIRKGDKVLVSTGDDRGKKGKVLKVLPDKDRVLVEGVNFVKKHTRPNQKNPQGGIVEKEAPVHASNLRVVCPGCGESAGLSRKRDADGKARRVCKSCGETL
ncbi:MAG TPA: 50S ribosomal protein L24 [Candidatus Fermentibacter daniensis]|jgi:large subunit ribosomal protein L24|nr:MAG: 50S ribosomal protein L24 [Candidatus Fermentibacter daniensis]MBP7720257.1 50S ribosomal protein L24 [Candidatus Fermentibacter sp.]OQC70828.1 MAG: 50S ribosomal protein L24 [candidate division Hyd24-12 bacterium ADurb.Bin004]KZD16535.1 MAG: 50S ribosomal protein L24 [Candidatus Fermentibacter daniensis]KZD16836.1 MAG: 50S ribosomal protein L24 [Candidatus Fermentibacter daniensis]